MNPVIRPALPEDGEAINRLIIALAEFEHLPPPDEAARQRLLADAFGPKPRFEIFLAEYGSDIAGYAFIYETYSTFLALPTLFLEDIFVLAEFRARKIGYALFKYCAEEAVRRGCGRMDWQVLDWNSNALNFYKKLGGQQLVEWQSYRLDQAALARLTGNA